MQVGDKVKILECHKIPGIVGMTGQVVEITNDKYPVNVKLDAPVGMVAPVPGGVAMGVTSGPFQFREDELELIGPGANPALPEGEGKTEIPDVFKKGMGE